MKRDAEGILKIFDFGIASDQGDITLASKGTRFYLAPELFRAPAQVLPALDIYAFGACCWALITETVPETLFDLPPQSKSSAPSIATAAPSLPTDIVTAIDGCLCVDPRMRPSALDLRALIYRHLVKDKHRAVLLGLENPVEMHGGNRRVALKVVGVGELAIEYDGFDFFAKQVSGEVYINNQPLVDGSVLHNSCVITFGNQERGYSRSFVDLNISHPEVVL